MLTTKPFKMNTYKSHPQVFHFNRLTQNLKSFRIRTYEKWGEGEVIVKLDTDASVANGNHLLL